MAYVPFSLPDLTLPSRGIFMHTVLEQRGCSCKGACPVMYFLKIRLNYRYDIERMAGTCDLSAEDAYSIMALDPTCTSNKVHVCFSPVFLIFTFGLWIKHCSISSHVINNILQKYLRSPFLIFAH